MEKNDSMTPPCLQLVNTSGTEHLERLKKKKKSCILLPFSGINEKKDFRPKVWPGLSSNCKSSHLGNCGNTQAEHIHRTQCFTEKQHSSCFTTLEACQHWIVHFPRFSDSAVFICQAAITKYHEPSGFNNVFIFSKFWRLEVPGQC